MVFTTLDPQVDVLATAIQSRVRESHTLATAFSLLSSVPGVGLITAASLIAWMGERGSLTHRKSAALIGVAPFAADSGKLKGSRHIRGGRDRPRTVRDRTAFSATFHNPDRIAFDQRLRNGGTPHTVALADRPGGGDAHEDRPHQRPAARTARLGEPDAAHGRLSSI